MEGILTLVGFLAMLLAFAAGFFLCAVQPVWGIVDVAASDRHSTGVKVTVIVLTLVLLGPIMTFFYAVFGSKSSAFRRTTLVFAGVFVLSVACVFGVAATQTGTNAIDALPTGAVEIETGDVDLAAAGGDVAP